MMNIFFISRLMDVKQGLNKEGKTVLYLVFEYVDTDLKKFIRSFKQAGQNIPQNTVKVLSFYPSLPSLNKPYHAKRNIILFVKS